MKLLKNLRSGKIHIAYLPCKGVFPVSEDNREIEGEPQDITCKRCLKYLERKLLENGL